MKTGSACLRSPRWMGHHKMPLSPLRNWLCAAGHRQPFITNNFGCRGNTADDSRQWFSSGNKANHRRQDCNGDIGGYEYTHCSFAGSGSRTPAANAHQRKRGNGFTGCCRHRQLVSNFSCSPSSKLTTTSTYSIFGAIRCRLANLAIPV